MPKKKSPSPKMTDSQRVTVDINKLKRRRDEIKHRLARIQSVVDNFDHNQNINIIKAREKIARDAFSEFINVQEAIEENMPIADLGAEADEKIAFEDLYFDTVASIESILEHNKEIKTATINEERSAISQNSKMNLPTVPIPEFSGALDKWLSFRDVFESLIHSNIKLTNVEKMHYLKSALSGEALRCIESLAISGSNYEEAWSLLHKRFENERLLIQTHIRNIINSPVITKSTSTAVRQLSDDIRTNISALKVLNRPTDGWDDILVTILSDKLDSYSSKEWQTSLTSKMPSLTMFVEFLEKRCQYLESISHSLKTKQIAENKPKFIKGQSTSHIVTKFQSCPICKKSNHAVFQCTNFLTQSVQERSKLVKNLKLCDNCLRSNHDSSRCKSPKRCRECNERHNTLLHLNIPVQEPISEAGPSSSANHCGFNQNYQSECLLSTAIVSTQDKYGRYHDCRVLLDNGSQSHFITEEFFNKLNLDSIKIEHKINGINKTESKITEMVGINLKSKQSNYATKINCLILNKITNNLPLSTFDTSSINIPENLALADQNFNISGPIDLLLGAQIFLELLKVGNIKLGRHLHLQNTCLGWILAGDINIAQNHFTTCNLSVNSKELQLLNKQVERFWELEAHDKVPVANPYTIEEQTCEDHFLNTFKREPDGRFMVQLPIRDNQLQLGNSEQIAKRRFFNLEKRFDKLPVLKTAYSHFMREYLSLKHMELVPPEEANNPDSWYLPHHAVFKQSNSQNQIRVVFDASAKCNNGLSLNDNLLTGPTIQQDLFSILLRFRIYPYVLGADIAKMYRQVNVDPMHTNYQKIFWRDNIDEPLKIYRLKTVTYGTTCAPFLAIRCLHQLAYENSNSFPLASSIILNQFYVDDLLTGSDSVEELREVQSQLIKILESGGFELRKWFSNESTLLPKNDDINDETIINLDKNGETKTLGLVWNCQHDSLKYKVEPVITPLKLTKRHILSVACRIFDPLGLINPIIVKAKILLQQLWTRKLDWDDEIPADIQRAWSNLMRELPLINEIKVPRNALIPESNHIELHGFADASEKAYGAVIYLKTVNDQNISHVQLLVAKSRVAPLKVISIPRLELLAAQLLAQLANRVLEVLNIRILKTIFWSDSTIVLAWLSKSPAHWQPFVANRIADIQNLTQTAHWRHINSENNPADILSRGANPSQLLSNNFWWNGPPFLLENEQNWPNTNPEHTDEIPEKRKIISVALSTNQNSLQQRFSNFSNFTKLKRSIAFLMRFIYNCKNVSQKRTGLLTTEELHEASNTIIKLVQEESFPKELELLKSNKLVKKSSPLFNLNPFLDRNNIIRVGGRLRHAEISFDKKFPAILPKNQHVTKLVILHFHHKYLHAGAQATLSAIRQFYWPISGRNTVKQLLHKCINCFKIRPTQIHQKMGDLPAPRITPSRPFLNTGIDYCGPILIKEGRGRGKKSVKTYIALFICLCTKAIHLELVSDLTSETFLNALKRFISRRGNVKHLYSDNATNFVGAQKELTTFLKNSKFRTDLTNTLANNDIKWSFIPPRTPNFGGLWEAGVKSVKQHLKKVIGETLLTFEEMYTFLTRVEACLNSRPLVPLSHDPNDLNVLTPGHFLIGEPLMAPPEPDLTEIKVNRLSRWQLTEQMRQHFWKRWRTEYMSQLHQRRKWKVSPQSPSSLRLGTMVLVVDENTAPLAWPLGRIIQTHPGKDGIVRVVTVKTAKGTYKRGISKICVLPLDDQTTN